MKNKQQEIKTPLIHSDNVIESDHHSLFIKNIPEEFIPVLSEDDETIEGIYQHTSPYNLYSIFLDEFRDNTKHGLHKIINALQEGSENDYVELHISSPGGYVDEGMALFNVLNAMYNGRVTTYINYGHSMGALAFLYGDERIVYESSSLMIHNWSGGLYGKSPDMEAYLEHSNSNLWKFFSKIIKPYLTKKEMKRVKRGEELWFEAYDMLDRGMATSIIMEGEVLTRDEYLEKYNKKGNIRKKWIKKQQKEDIQLEP